MDSVKISIRPEHRVLFAGTTGFGKTVLAKYLLEKMHRVMVIDPKHTFRLEGYRLSKGVSMFDNKFRFIYRPKLGDDENLAKLLYQLFKKKNCTIYCDELSTLNDLFPLSTKVLADIERTGREPRVAVWAAVQRPRRVPVFFITESEILFQFNLRSSDDRDYLAGFVGDEVRDRVKYFQFWYTHPEIETPVLMTLERDKNVIIRV
jgi:hypothetical protein